MTKHLHTFVQLQATVPCSYKEKSNTSSLKETRALTRQTYLVCGNVNKHFVLSFSLIDTVYLRIHTCTYYIYVLTKYNCRNNQIVVRLCKYFPLIVMEYTIYKHAMFHAFRPCAAHHYAE